jgi:hypothetical protein
VALMLLKPLLQTMALLWLMLFRMPSPGIILLQVPMSGNVPNGPLLKCQHVTLHVLRVLLLTGSALRAAATNHTHNGAVLVGSLVAPCKADL